MVGFPQITQFQRVQLAVTWNTWKVRCSKVYHAIENAQSMYRTMGRLDVIPFDTQHLSCFWLVVFCMTLYKKPVSERYVNIWVLTFGVFWTRIRNPRSLGSLCVKGTDGSTLIAVSPPRLLYKDPCDLGSLILARTTPKGSYPIVKLGPGRGFQHLSLSTLSY